MSDFFKNRLDSARSDGLLRKLRLIDDAQGTHATLENREILLFCSNNYLGLANHPAVKQACIEAIEKYGAGAGASRLVSGNMVPHKELESALARFVGKEAAILYNSGYQANVGLFTALLEKQDTVYADKLCHASILDGVRWSGAQLIRFRHNDPESLKTRMATNTGSGKRLVVTEGVFSMDGDIAPLRELAVIAKEHGANFIVDDAHGFGLYGGQGRGTVDLAGVKDLVDIHIVTLGKALGGAGGVVIGSRVLIDGLVNFSRPFIFSTAIAPAQAMAGIRALEIISCDEGERLRKALFNNVEKVKTGLNRLSYDLGRSATQILSVIIGDEGKAVRMSAKLLEGGVYIPAVRYPTVQKGGARLRLTLASGHTTENIEHLLKIFGTMIPV